MLLLHVVKIIRFSATSFFSINFVVRDPQNRTHWFIIILVSSTPVVEHPHSNRSGIPGGAHPTGNSKTQKKMKPDPLGPPIISGHDTCTASSAPAQLRVAAAPLRYRPRHPRSPGRKIHLPRYPPKSISQRACKYLCTAHRATLSACSEISPCHQWASAYH